MIKIKIIYIDDDKENIAYFNQIASSIHDIALVATFTNAKDASKYCKENMIDIVFTDIEMPEFDGFWLAKDIAKKACKIVFVTAFSEYAISAFEACALHYLLKPISKQDIIDVMQRFESQYGKKEEQYHNQIDEYINQYKNDQGIPKRIFISSYGKIEVINLDQLLYISSDINYSVFHLSDGTIQTSSRTLKIYNDAIGNHPDFIRIHRSHLINKKYVKSIIREDQSKLYIEMTNKVKLDVSRNRRDEILEGLKY